MVDWAGVNPAVIYGETHALEGESVKFKCTLPKRDKNKVDAHMYLCKNAIGIRLEEFHVGGEAEVLFRIPKVEVSDAGNYSCVYSKTKFRPYDVSSADKNVTIIPLGNACCVLKPLFSKLIFQSFFIIITDH